MAYQIRVRAVGRMTDPKEFERIVVKRAPNGSLIELRDVGRAELGSESYGGKIRFNGIDVVGVGVQQLSNANALDVKRDVIPQIFHLPQPFPQALKSHIPS